MSDKKAIGALGEKLAGNFLVAKGYQIIGRNVQLGRAEIDLITKDGNQFVFVEVKTRRSIKYGYPEESVDRHKEKMLIDAADEYCENHQIEGGIRFDIVAVIINQNVSEIKHFEDAFQSWSE